MHTCIYFEDFIIILSIFDFVWLMDDDVVAFLKSNSAKSSDCNLPRQASQSSISLFVPISIGRPLTHQNPNKSSRPKPISGTCPGVDN